MAHTLKIGLFAALIAAGVSVQAADFFVAPAGDDANPGTLEKPFATIQHAQEAVAPGDTVYIRGGTYVMNESQIARKERIWAYVHFLSKSGTPDKRINYWAYQKERPVFDFSQVKPADLRVDAFHVTGSWVHIKGLEVIGVQVTIKGHTQSICFANNGSHNIYELLSTHDGQAIGIYSVRGSDSLFLNCDAYRNRDFTSEDGKGGNVDGFGCHPPKGGTGNVFRGCRAWFNSDDGYDCINAHESVTFENCWALYSGFSPTFERLADGNGFKAGGYGSTPAERLPNPIPRHTVRFCLAVRNKASGFYS
ncbi:MAG: pectate lyase, partial [Tepidisphaerales bacterium]